jgi:hypothetical protein
MIRTKVRAWDEKAGKMVYSFGGDSGYVLMQDETGELIVVPEGEDRRLPVMFSTGYRSNIGEEIYDGDFITAAYRKNLPEFLVFWNQDTLRFECSNIRPTMWGKCRIVKHIYS